MEAAATPPVGCRGAITAIRHHRHPPSPPSPPSAITAIRHHRLDGRFMRAAIAASTGASCVQPSPLRRALHACCHRRLDLSLHACLDRFPNVHGSSLTRSCTRGIPDRALGIRCAVRHPSFHELLPSSTASTFPLRYWLFICSIVDRMRAMSVTGFASSVRAVVDCA